MPKRTRDVILRTYLEGDRLPVDVSANANIDLIESVLNQMDWSRLAFVTLSIDDDNFLECSGSMIPAEGLCLKLMHEGAEFISDCSLAQPTDSLAAFREYLAESIDVVFRIILDADRRGLTIEDIDEIRTNEVDSQKRSKMEATLTSAAQLFSGKKYSEFVAALAPFEDVLSPLDRKKLALARKRAV